MSIVVRHFGRIKDNGEIKFYDPDMWEQQRFDLRGKEFELVIKEKRKRPSVDQYAYYFGGILKTCLKTEYFSHYSTPEELNNDIFEPMFLGYSKQVVMGEKMWTRKYNRTVSDLNKVELKEFIDKVLRFCEEQDIMILSPEQYKEDYYKTIIK